MPPTKCSNVLLWMYFCVPVRHFGLPCVWKVQRTNPPHLKTGIICHFFPRCSAEFVPDHDPPILRCTHWFPCTIPSYRLQFTLHAEPTADSNRTHFLRTNPRWWPPLNMCLCKKSYKSRKWECIDFQPQHVHCRSSSCTLLLLTLPRHVLSAKILLKPLTLLLTPCERRNGGCAY